MEQIELNDLMSIYIVIEYFILPILIMQSDDQLAKYGISDLSSCSSGTSCASYIIQIVISTSIIIWLIVEFALQIKSQIKTNFSWREVMLVQIFLCLTFNICFALWNQILIWYVLECLFFHLYFTTLVFYFCKKYIEKAVHFETRSFFIVSLILIYAFFCLIQLGIFIYQISQGLSHCKQLFELIIDGFMIILGIISLAIAYKNQNQQLKKFEDFKVGESIKNPLKQIWLWIGFNIFGQIANQIQSILIYTFYEGQKCYLIENSLQNDILSPLFMALSYLTSFCSTLWFYKMKRMIQQQSLLLPVSTLQLSSAQIDVQNNLEVIKQSSISDTSFKSSIVMPLMS